MKQAKRATRVWVEFTAEGYVYLTPEREKVFSNPRGDLRYDVAHLFDPRALVTITRINEWHTDGSL